MEGAYNGVLYHTEKIRNYHFFTNKGHTHTYTYTYIHMCIHTYTHKTGLFPNSSLITEFITQEHKAKLRGVNRRQGDSRS